MKRCDGCGRVVKMSYPPLCPSQATRSETRERRGSGRDLSIVLDSRPSSSAVRKRKKEGVERQSEKWKERSRRRKRRRGSKGRELQDEGSE